MGTFISILAIMAFFILPAMAKIKKAMATASLTETEDTPVSNEIDEEAVAEEPYFTYENQNADFDPVQPVKTAPTAAPTDMTAPNTQFDLRQAVIYQTILNNNYISEIK